MFDYQTSKHAHFDAACRAFALAHNLEDVAAAVGKAARNGIFHRNDIAPLAIRANSATVAHFVKARKFNAGSFLIALFPFLTCPERVCLMGFG